MQNFPSMIRRKKHVTSDLKIKAFVSLLFLVIVFLVGYAYIMYHQKVLARLYFDRVKFDKNHRHIKVFDSFGNDKINGKLGKNIHSGKPFHCLDKSTINNGSFCLEWDRIARLYMSYEQRGAADCYAIRWQSLDVDHFPEDCYDFTATKGHWYGGGITRANEWPFDAATFEFTPFITGDATTHPFGNALKRYFVSSGGVSIEIDERTPLYLSMNAAKSPRQFCMKAMNDQFAFVNRLTPRSELNYKICLAPNMKVLHQQLTQKSLWDGLTEADIQVVHSILEEPVWQIPASNFSQLSEHSIYNYTEDVIDMGFLRLGHVLVNEFWQPEIGDFILDTERFPTLENTVNILHRRGFKVVFTFQPFISTDSRNFADVVDKKFLIYERLSERTIPALTRYKSSPSSGVIDVTNNDSIPWLVDKLKLIVKNYQIDSFYIDYGTAYNMPHYYQCSKSLINPDQYKSLFTAAIVDQLPIFGVSGAVAVPKPPAFLGLPPVNSSWQGLQSIVTSALSYGVIGFPFIMPGPVGGDYLLPPGNLSTIISYRSLPQPPLPEMELFIRWLQLATFLPSIRYSHLPSEYKSNFVTEVAKDLTSVRQKIVITVMKKYVNDAFNEGVPLVRPLWMVDINDPSCLIVNDEFAIGEELIVAPILTKGQTKREGRFIMRCSLHIFINLFPFCFTHSLFATRSLERRN